jgi:hypothetical protein
MKLYDYTLVLVLALMLVAGGFMAGRNYEIRFTKCIKLEPVQWEKADYQSTTELRP